MAWGFGRSNWGHTVADLVMSVVGLGVTIRNSVLDILSLKGMVDIQVEPVKWAVGRRGLEFRHMYLHLKVS